MVTFDEPGLTAPRNGSSGFDGGPPSVVLSSIGSDSGPQPFLFFARTTKVYVVFGVRLVTDLSVDD